MKIIFELKDTCETMKRRRTLIHEVKATTTVNDLYESFETFLTDIGFEEDELVDYDLGSDINTKLDDIDGPFIPEECDESVSCEFCNIKEKCDLGKILLEADYEDNDVVLQEKVNNLLDNAEYVEEFKLKLATDDNLVQDVLSVYLNHMYSNIN